MVRNIYLISFLLVCSLFVSVTLARAQFDSGASTDIEIKLSPVTPSPGQTVTAEAISYSIDMPTASFSWTVDGKQVASGVGKRTISFTVGGIGSRTTVAVSARSAAGKVLEKTFHYGDTFEEAAIEKQAVKFLYHHRGEYWFSAPDDPKNRFTLKEEIIGAPAQFLKANIEAAAIRFNNAIIGMDVPIKIDLAVKDAPPSIRGNTAQGGTKSVTLETGATINAPLFVNAGDVIRVNTQTGEYVERVEKTKR